MRTSERWMLLLVCAVVPAARLKADEPAIRWVRNLDDAKQIALAEEKDLLINFTGHGWCYSCTLLDREVFSQAEFARAAKDFVLVELDFPSAEDVPTADLKDYYQKWKEQYLVHGIPTVVVADSTGRPYAYTGYTKGITAAKFLENLASYRNVRQTRDRAFAEAEKLTGIARAQKLHAAIKAVTPLLGTIEVRQEDPVLVFYDGLVEEIRHLDADSSGGLRSLYDGRIAARNAWRGRDEVLIRKELDRFKANKDDPAALAYLEQILPGIKDEELRWRVELARQVHLEWDRQYEKALENGRRLLNAPPKTSQVRERLLDSEAWMLSRLGRTAEMAESLDRRILEAADRPTARLRLLKMKATNLWTNGEPEQKIAAWRDYRSATVPKSENWVTATAMLAAALARDDQHEAAISVNKELLNYYREAETAAPGVLLSIAESQRALGALDEAKTSLHQAEEAIKALPTNPERDEDKQTVPRLKEHVAKLRQLIEPGD